MPFYLCYIFYDFGLRKMKVSDILTKKTIAVSLQVNSKNELLDKMLELAYESGNIVDKEETKKEIYERERIMSTGVGKGIALPHAKTNAVKDTVCALALLKEPVDFESLDGKPVNLVFLLIGRENNVGNHLRLLSRISRLINNDSFRSRLSELSSADEIIALFAEVEEND
jgi:fructose PTS system EIIBC or EIIC component